MTIAFDISAENGLFSSAFEMQLKSFLVKLAKDLPAHSFIIYDKKSWPQDLPVNIAVHQSRKAAGNSWFSRFFGKRSSGSDVMITLFRPHARRINGTYLLISDLSPLAHPEHFTSRQRLRFKKELVKAIASAKGLIVCSGYYRQFLISQLQVPEHKVQLWELTTQVIIKETGGEEREQVKERFAEGKEYFLFPGDLHPRHELITLLKAFSDFKKWQRSGIKLILAGHESAWSPELETLLVTYKYREDVVLIKDPADAALQELISAAYCIVYPALYDPFPQIIKSAMASRVPVISNDIPEIRSIAGDRLIYAEASPLGLSHAMQRIFKDETWRSEVIEKAFNQPGIHVQTAAAVLKDIDPRLQS